MTTHKKPRPRLALALSGGAARCIAHIGVLQVLEEAGIPVDAVAGTSAGAIVGALYLDGMPPDEMARAAGEIRWRSILTPTLPRTGLISSSGIGRFVRGRLRAREIGELGRPFAAVCADLTTGEKVVLTRGPLALAVQASCSLPVIFTPTRVGGRLLIDGGYVSQIPVLAAREELHGGVVVAVDVNYKSEGRPSLGNLIGISSHLTQLLARKNALAETPYADAVINVDIDGISLHDIGRHKDLLGRGRAAAEAALPDVIGLLAGLGD